MRRAKSMLKGKISYQDTWILVSKKKLFQDCLSNKLIVDDKKSRIFKVTYTSRSADENIAILSQQLINWFPIMA